ncbi:MAG: hypothetical protein IKT34_03500 [Clostridia bacterium]|nr:hypothetical protein [Clostridia bacterium]
MIGSRTTTASVRWVINMKRILLLFLAVLMTVALVSCDKDGVVDGEATPHGFKNPETGIEYVECTPKGLYAVNKGDDFITVGADIYSTVLHEDSERFLCIEDSGELLLYRALDVKEPNVSEFKPIAAQVYSSTNTTLITYFYADNKYLPDDKKEHNPSEDSALCELIAKHLTEGEAVTINATYDTITDQYFIRLLSQDYPGLYYLVAFYGFEGRYYLVDRATNKTVLCPYDVIVRMVGE